jgi:putative redox protein
MADKMNAVVRLVDGMQFVGVSGTGHAVVMDTVADYGGTNSGAKPMEMLLIGLGGCTGMDVASMLRKMRQPFTGLTMSVTGTYNDSEEYPRYLTGIHVEYTVKGDVDEAQLKKAIDLSEEKYCSVGNTLKGVAKITASWKIERE